MNKERILVIDDEPAIRKLLQITLESNDYSVTLAETAKLGIQLAAAQTPDLIILDLGLPDKNGLEVLTELRQWYENGIVILSVQDDEYSIVKALDNGASDYLTKPFRSAELMARIRSCIRRNHSQNVLKTTFESAGLVIDFVNRTVKKNDCEIKLTQTEYNLLVLLAKNEDRVLTHQYLLKEIWGVGQQNETHYLRVFIGTLRKKIEDDPHRPLHILTESGVGYRFR